MLLFISYAQGDLPLARQLAERLPKHTVRYWEQDKVPSRPAWPTIQHWIDEADIVVPILTEGGGVTNPNVNQEVGYAVKAGKRIAPIVGAQVAHASLGMLQATTFIALEAIEKIVDGVMRAIQDERDARVRLAMGVLLFAFVAWVIYQLAKS